MTTARALTSTRDRLREAYGTAIGRRRDELITPALLLDLDIARRNIALMAERMRPLAVGLRPHIKGHKSPDLARLQIDAGAIGVATATVWEAVTMVRSGIPNVLIANQVVGREKVSALAKLAVGASVTVAVDDPANVEDLARAAAAAGSEIGILIEVDIGMGRCGVRSPEAAVTLARLIAGQDGVVLRGVQGYEGHCMSEPDATARAALVRAATDRLSGAVDALRSAGHRVEVVSGGGTGTYDMSGAHGVMTEIQAGSYVLMDTFHEALAPEFGAALTVLGTVVSRQRGTFILDAGAKSVGTENATARLRDRSERPRDLNEEHAIFDIDESGTLHVGDTVEIVPGYAPSAVNLHDVYHVIEGGRVTDIWPIMARGPGHGGLLAG
jgi:D-serine deaminase-like pyridoxal phosphate-dependent protein